MDGSGNHDGRRQQQLAVVVQWAAGWQSNCIGQWEGGSVRDGTMAAYDCHQHRSGAMGGNARWTAAAITMNGV